MLEPDSSLAERRARVTRLVTTARAASKQAAHELLPLVYDELRRLASARLAREQGGAGHTLQPTALVHECYLRLIGNEDGHELAWNGKSHFFGAAALAMRRILVERGRRQGRPQEHTDLDQLPSTREFGTLRGRVIDYEDLDRALTALELHDLRKHSVVMLRFFAGLGVDDAARALEVSEPTVKRDWSFARAWLLEWIEDHSR